MSRPTLGIAALAIATFACGSNVDSSFGDADGKGTPYDDGTPTGSNGLPEIGPNGTSSACVTEVASSELAPTNLVFVYDKSGSMGDAATGFDPARRWIPIGAGMKQFFADEYSKTLRASLQFFPLSDTSIESACGHAYASPTVALTSASDAAFVAAIDSTKPSGGTPTLPALEGGIAYAQQIAAARPNDKTAVVLVTDGQPGFWDSQQSAFKPGCTNNDVAHIAAAAAAAFKGSPAIPTYVIGVGPDLETLSSVAAAGGTNAAIMVDVNNPTATTSTIVSALDGIRRREISCDFSVPPPPPGQELDPNAVNVILKNPNGSENVLAYSKECASEDGWRYDNPASPTRILLCSASCTAAKQATDGKVSIALGCKTKTTVR